MGEEESCLGLGEGEGTDKEQEEKEPERGTWSNPCDFFISCLGYAVGLGLFWSHYYHN